MRYTLVHDWMLEIHDNGQEIVKTGTGCFPEDHDHSAQEELVRRANAYDDMAELLERAHAILLNIEDFSAKLQMGAWVTRAQYESIIRDIEARR